MTKKTRLVGALLIGTTALVVRGYTEVVYDAGKNVIVVRGEDIRGLQEIAARLNRPDIFAYNASTREARSRAGIEIAGGRTGEDTCSIGKEGKQTTLTFLMAPDTKPRSTALVAKSLRTFRLVNSVIRAENTDVPAEGAAPSPPRKFSGIVLSGIPNVEISGCRVLNVSRAFGLNACGRAVMTDVVVREADYGVFLSSAGGYVMRNVDIESKYTGIGFLNFTGSPDIADSRVRTKGADAIFLSAGSSPKMTPHIAIVNVRYDREKTGFCKRPGLLSIGWHVTMKVLNADGSPQPDAAIMFTPECDFEPAEVLGLLEPGRTRTDADGEARVDLIEGIMAKANPREERSGGKLYAYRYRVAVDSGQGWKELKDLLSVTDNMEIVYTAGGDTYRRR